jgi:hypothetical protein
MALARWEKTNNGACTRTLSSHSSRRNSLSRMRMPGGGKRLDQTILACSVARVPGGHFTDAENHQEHQIDVSVIVLPPGQHVLFAALPDNNAESIGSRQPVCARRCAGQRSLAPACFHLPSSAGSQLLSHRRRNAMVYARSFPFVSTIAGSGFWRVPVRQGSGCAPEACTLFRLSCRLPCSEVHNT